MSAGRWGEDATIVTGRSSANVDARVKKFGDEITTFLSDLGDDEAEAKAAAIAALVPTTTPQGRQDETLRGTALDRGR